MANVGGLGWLAAVGSVVLLGCGQVEDAECGTLDRDACARESRCVYVGVVTSLRDEVGACRQRCDDGKCPSGSCVGNVPDYEDSSNVELTAVNACLVDGE